jgi:transposase
VIKAVKFRIFPTQEQQNLLEGQFGCIRFAWNWILDYTIWQYRDNNTITFKKEWRAILPVLKEYMPLWYSQ